MKYTIKSILMSLFILSFGYASGQSIDSVKVVKAKKIETVKLKVQGVCDMCKKRVENAALIKGVKMAVWDKKTQELKVIYSPKKTTLDKIHKAIAEKGHDTLLAKAPDEVYGKLPDCCKYRDGVKVH